MATRNPITWRTSYLIVSSVIAGVAIATIPSLAMKLAAVVGVAGVFAAFELARRGRFLDPAWVIVGQLYLFPFVGSLLIGAGLEISAITVLNLAFLPFLAAALVLKPESRPALVLTIPLVLLGLIAAASTTWSPDAAYGLDKVSVYFVNGVLPAISVIVLFAATRSISWPLIAGSAFAFALGLLVLGSGWDTDPTRQTLFGQNPIASGRIIMAGAIVVLFGSFRPAAKVVMLPVMLVAGLLTLSLGPLVGFGVGVLAGTVEALRVAARAGRSVAVYWIALVGLIGFGAVVWFSGVLAPILAPILDDPNVTSRTVFLSAAVPLIESSPVFGIGFGGFNATGLVEHPHNLFAEVLVELGVIGLVVALTWIVLALRGGAGSPLMVALVLTTLSFTMFSGNLGSQTVFWLFSALAVAMLAVPKRALEPAALTRPPAVGDSVASAAS